jgi:hypothetical protein
MCELYAIKLVWAKVKHLIRENNTASDLSLKVLEEKTRAAVGQVTAEDWTGYCNHVVRLEQDYWEKDGLMEDTIDSFIIHLGEDSNDEDDNDNDDDDRARNTYK